MDHVHVSFESSADAGHTYPNYKNHDPAPDTPWNKALGAAGNIKDALAWLGNRHNWFRLFLVFAGAILIGFGLLKFDNVSAAVGNVAAIGKAVK